MFHSLKFCIVVIYMAEVHRIRPTERRLGMPVRTVPRLLKVKLSAQRNVYSRLKGGGVDTEDFIPSDPRTESFH